MSQRFLALGLALLAGLPAAGGAFAADAAAAVAPKPAILSAKAAQSLLLDVVLAGQRLVAVGERGHVVLSDDDGVSWRQVATPTRALLTSAWFIDDRRGWVAGHDSTILHTADGGETWVVQHHELHDAAAVEAELDAQFSDEEDEYAGVEAARAPSKAQRIGAPLFDIWFDAAGRHGLAIGAYGLVLESNDGGASWRDRSNLLANDDGWHLTSIAAGATNRLLIVGEKGIAFGSADGGRTFSRIKTPAESSLFGAVGTAGNYWAFGLQGRLYKVAGNWQPVATGVTYGFNDAVVLADGTVVVVGNGGMVVTVPPGGKPVVVRRDDRQVVSAVVAVKDGLVLVGAGGAKRARIDGSAH